MGGWVSLVGRLEMKTPLFSYVHGGSCPPAVLVFVLAFGLVSYCLMFIGFLVNKVC